MAATKLVKNLLILIIFCTEIKYMVDMRAFNEEDNVPDAHIIYDQRQSGKYNIHVVIKDVAIIEMDQNEIADENYNDEEYYYDEEDLTVKPLNIKTTSTTSMNPLENLTGDKTTLSSAQTTIPYLQNQTDFLESTDLQLPANYSKPFHKEEIHNNQTSDPMKLLSTHRPSMDTESRSKIEPIYAIEEPALQPRHNAEKNSNTFSNSRIFKVKVHRSHRASQITPPRERCRSNQYRDGGGICRGKRSSSGTILKRLFKMLFSLPFGQDEQKIAD